MSNFGGTLGIYSPIPQAITDSDSEEELHSSIISKNLTPRSESKQEVAMTNGHTGFHNLNTVEELDEHNGFVNNAENVRIIDGNKKGEQMSPLRKLLFVLSIIICFLTIVIFLWVLPCSETGQCSGSTGTAGKKSSWENPYYDIELKGAISIVDGAPGMSKNLIVLFRGDVINPEHFEGVRSSSGNGIISIVGDSGKIGWLIRQPQLPTDIDCSLIDVDGDGAKDCIVIGKDGLFAAFSSLPGIVYWYLHSHDNSHPFSAVDFPLVLMDLDGDGINDMVTSCAPYQSENHNALIFVSGRQGSVIGTPLVISECMSINKLQIDKDHVLSFTCKNNTSLSESSRFMTLEELYKSITNKLFNNKWNNWAISRQHQVYGQRKETENQRNIYGVDKRKLIVENQGHCPKNCKVTVQLVDERTGNDNISWEYTNTRVYGMVPATLSFKNNALKNRIAGFVLKFWQWNAGLKSSNRYDRNADSSVYSIFSNNVPFTTKDKVNNSTIHKRDSQETKQKISKNVTINHLTERVVLVTFNATDIHIVNASQSDIIQMCFEDKGEIACQPDMGYQENSLSITDLDGDGSQELITYLTSFVCTETASLDEYYGDAIKCDGEWKLRSTVRIVRLEAELPKLYEAVSHH